MKILYNIHTGYIYTVLENNVDIHRRYRDYPSDIMDNLMELPCNIDGISLGNIVKYKVVNGEIVDRPLNEIRELKKYGKVLTDEERLNILLQPSSEEISKAESTLEMLIMLQEVGLI